MVAPNPKLRISPSGPLAGDADPLKEFAGVAFGADGDADYIAHLGPAAFSNPADLRVEFYRADGPVPVTGNPAQQIALDPLNSDTFDLTEGVWLVEAVISCGFNTSGPLEAGVWGDLDVVFHALNTAGNPVASSTNVLSPIPRGVYNSNEGDEDDYGLNHSTVKRALLTVSPEAVTANSSQPLPGLAMAVVRTDGQASTVGDYTSSSGWLEFTRDVSISVRRYR